MADTQTWQDILDVDDVRDEADFADMTTDAIQSQYAHAKRIRGVAEKVRQEIDATQDMVDLHGMVADMQTAQGVYLDWWGQRVGVDRLLKVKGEWCRFVFTLPSQAPNPGGMKRLPDEAGGAPAVEDPASMKPVE